MFASIVVSAAEQAEEQHVELPMSAVAYGLFVLGAMVALLLVTMAFRSVRHRH